MKSSSNIKNIIFTLNIAVTALTPIAKNSAVELSLPVFTTEVCPRPGFDHPTFRLRSERSKCDTTAA